MRHLTLLDKTNLIISFNLKQVLVASTGKATMCEPVDAYRFDGAAGLNKSYKS